MKLLKLLVTLIIVLQINALSPKEKKAEIVKEFKNNNKNSTVIFGDLFIVKETTHPALYETIAHLCKKLNIPVPIIFVINTDHKYVGAHATKFFKFTFMFLGYNLIKMLNYDEIESVIAHELCHIKCNHTNKLLLLNLPILFLIIYLYTKNLISIEKISYTPYLLLGIRRKFEKEADLTATQIINAKHLLGALEKLYNYDEEQVLKYFKCKFNFFGRLSLLTWVKYKIFKSLPDWIQEICSTHPSWDTRKAYLQEVIARQSLAA